MKKQKKSVIGLSLTKSYLFLLFLFPFISSYSIDAGTAAIKAENAPYNQALKSMQAKTEQQMLMKTTEAATAASPKTNDSPVMILDPLTRAQDFKEAFSYLSQHKAGSPIFFELENKEKLYNILDLSVMKGGSLIIFKMNTTQGLKYKVVKIEEINAIGTES